MRLLELLALAPLSAPQLAAAMHAQPRTVRRVLARLVEEEYVTVASHGRRRVYEPTMRLVALAGQVVETSRLARVGRPHVELLNERVRRPTHLLVPSYRSVLCLLHAADSHRDARPHLRELVPAHCTAGGKALLAWRERWRDSVLSVSLERCTERTLVDPEALRTELRRTRERGYAVESGEYREEAHAVAVPVIVDGQAVAALCVSGTDLDPAGAAPAVRSIAARLGQDLERP